MSKALATWLPLTDERRGRVRRAGQCRQGALYQAFAHVSNGARLKVAQLSRDQVDHACGHWMSVHWTPLYTAKPLSSPNALSDRYSFSRSVASPLWMKLLNRLPRSSQVTW